MTIRAVPATVFRFLTVPSEIQEWLCNRAVGGLGPGRSCVLFWEPGWSAVVKSVQVTPPVSLVLSWRGDGDPAETRVHFTLVKVRSGTRLHLVHSGMSSGKEWKRPLAEMEKGWDRSLENLKSIIETGIDLRIARRPFLGIGFEEVTPQHAERERLPFQSGIRITEVVPDSGAARAGLRRGDILLRMGKRTLENGRGFLSVLQAHRAGETVKLLIYRNRKKSTVNLTLSARKILSLPATHKAVVSAVKKVRDDLIPELDELLEDASEAAGERKPAPDKWSAKEVLAHLILAEQYFRAYAVSDFAGASLDFTENTTVFPEALAGVLRVNPTLKSLRDRLQSEQEETLAVLEHLRDDFRDHKARYRRMVTGLLEYPKHTRHHFRQLMLALQGKPLS